MSDFRQRSQNMQIELEQQCSVKRCVELSPSCKQPFKRSATENVHRAETSAKHLDFGETATQTTQSQSMEASPSFLPLTPALEESPSLLEENLLPFSRLPKFKKGKKSWERGCVSTSKTEKYLWSSMFYT